MNIKELAAMWIWQFVAMLPFKLICRVESETFSPNKYLFFFYYCELFIKGDLGKRLRCTFSMFVYQDHFATSSVIEPSSMWIWNNCYNVSINLETSSFKRHSDREKRNATWFTSMTLHLKRIRNRINLPPIWSFMLNPKEMHRIIRNLYGGLIKKIWPTTNFMNAL